MQPSWFISCYLCVYGQYFKTDFLALITNLEALPQGDYCFPCSQHLQLPVVLCLALGLVSSPSSH